MEIQIDTKVTPCRITLTGEMTIYAAADLKQQLVAPIDSTNGLEIDLSQVSEIDTAGMQLLILAKRYAEQTGKSLHLVGHSRPVLELIELYSLGALFGDPIVIPASEH